jgi:F0F1-type ATP synthase alpha subunit
VTVPKISKQSDVDNIRVYNQADFENFPAKIKERVEVLVKRSIPLTATTLSKINIPIPSSEENDHEQRRRLAFQHVDELISMSDGQIWLDERLLEQPNPQQPPIDPQRSVTRIGIGADTKSRADAPALAKIVEGVRLHLSQAAATAIGLDQAADVASSVASAKQIRRQRALLLAMHQRPGQMGRRLSESCVLLLAAKEGYFDNAVENGVLGGTDPATKLVEELLAHVKASSASSLTQINETLDLSQDARLEIFSSISSFFAALEV